MPPLPRVEKHPLVDGPRGEPKRSLLWLIGLTLWASACGGNSLINENGGGPGAVADGSATTDSDLDARSGSDIGSLADASTDGLGSARASDAASDASSDASSDANILTRDPTATGDANAGAADASIDAPADVTVDAPRDASVDALDASACAVDCNHLPNVRPGTFVACLNGQCIAPVGACLDGFAHCTVNPNDGCETDITRPETCGSCYQACSGFYPTCRAQFGSYNCAQNCGPPTPDACDYYCVDFSSDVFNCGGCGVYCSLPNASAACQQGVCVAVGCYDINWADCTAAPGCETQLETAENCGGCGDRACTLANSLLTCGSDTHCATAVCAPGFANCNVTSPDCETAFAIGGPCLPTYIGTVPIATTITQDAPVAVAADGSYFIAGAFSGTVDFDPTTTGMDIQTAFDASDGYISKYAADGSYLWTRVFTGRGDVRIERIAPASGGAVVLVGSYTDTIDLDPSSGVSLHQTVNLYGRDVLMAKLAADGSFVWGETFAGTDLGLSAEATGVSVDGTDNVYVAGYFSGSIDLDPGPGSEVHSNPYGTGMLVKMDGAGALVWARVIDNGTCSVSLTAMTLAPDGSAWATGNFALGCMLGSQSDGGVTAQGNDTFVMAYGPAGNLRGTWTFGSASGDAANAIAAGADGSIYVGGQSQGNVDFDPGTGIAQRRVPSGGGYVLSLGSDGTFRWVQTLAAVPVLSLAPTPDGGVLAVGGAGSFSFQAPTGAFLTKMNGDGSSAWTFTAGAINTGARAVAAGSAGFVLSGFNSGSADFNPGAGIDIVFGDVTFISHYAF